MRGCYLTLPSRAGLSDRIFRNDRNVLNLHCLGPRVTSYRVTSHILVLKYRMCDFI